MKTKIDNYAGLFFLYYKKRWWHSWTCIFTSVSLTDTLNVKRMVLEGKIV